MSPPEPADDATARYPSAWTRWEEDEDEAYEVTPADVPTPEQEAELAVEKRRKHAQYMREYRRRGR